MVLVTSSGGIYLYCIYIKYLEVYAVVCVLELKEIVIHYDDFAGIVS